jgi:AraC-like DNA-binding protein
MTIYSHVKWSLSEFLMHLDLRGQTWCIVEIGQAAGFSIPPSDQVYFYAALEGEVRIAGGAAEPMCLKEGDAAVILSGDAHAVRIKMKCHMEIIDFLHDGSYSDIPPVFHTGEGSPAARVLCGRLKVRWPGGLLPTAIPAAIKLEANKNMISTHDLEQSAKGTGAAALLTKIACLLLTSGLRQHAQHMEIFPAFAMNDPIDRALQLIDQHAEVSWTVAGLAQKVGMGRSNFAARFLESTGRTPIEALADRRMQCAADLLQHGPLKISEIAMRVGYNSEAAFIRRFVDKFGVTPGRMRASLQSRPQALHA